MQTQTQTAARHHHAPHHGQPAERGSQSPAAAPDDVFDALGLLDDIRAAYEDAKADVEALPDPGDAVTQNERRELQAEIITAKARKNELWKLVSSVERTMDRMQQWQDKIDVYERAAAVFKARLAPELEALQQCQKKGDWNTSKYHKARADRLHIALNSLTMYQCNGGPTGNCHNTWELHQLVECTKTEYRETVKYWGSPCCGDSVTPPDIGQATPEVIKELGSYGQDLQAYTYCVVKVQELTAELETLNRKFKAV